MTSYYIAFLGGEPYQDMREAAGPFESTELAAAAESSLRQSMLRQRAPKEPAVVGDYFAMEVNGPANMSAVIGPYKTQIEAEACRVEEAKQGGATFANTDGFIGVVRIVKQSGPRSTQVAVIEGLTLPRHVDKRLKMVTQ